MSRNNHYHCWTTGEERFLKKNYKNMTAIQIAGYLGVSYRSVTSKVSQLELRKQKGRPRSADSRFTDFDNKVLAEYYSKRTVKELAAFLRKSYTNVYRQCQKLGITVKSQI